ncbi:Pyridinium-3,5-bisthiocarboxylic acid mononucleotide nickel insertion protein [Propionicimonas sp. T2.31MG-18]
MTVRTALIRPTFVATCFLAGTSAGHRPTYDRTVTSQKNPLVTSLSAWIDAGNGLAGDMLLAALLDAGARLEAVVAAVEAVLPDTVRLELSEVRRAGLRAAKLDVVVLVEDQHHRHWSTIRSMLAGADLPEPVRASALAVFGALAAAEARAHGIDPEEVHFHEVGAWDSIADIVGVCAAVDDLGLAGLSCGTVALGSGTVRAAHGQIPVPVPAVLELATGWPVVAGGRGELTTPTGMALVSALATPRAELPAGVVRAVGVGAGTRDDPGRPNVVRVVLGEFTGGGPAAQAATLLAANVDDLDPRLWPGVLAALLEAGADDAWLTPILMKKGRPAHTLEVLCRPALAGPLGRLVYELVPTLGLRETPTTKRPLEREWRQLSVLGQPVRIKLGLAGGRIATATPEFEDVAAAARATGRPERAVMAAAEAAAAAAGLLPGARRPE